MASQTSGERAAELGFPWDHEDYICPGTSSACEQGACQFCDGGLTACSVCNGFEGAMPTQCPKRKMTADEADAVYAGNLDFRGGTFWVGMDSFWSPTGWRQLLTPEDLAKVEAAEARQAH